MAGVARARSPARGREGEGREETSPLTARLSADSPPVSPYRRMSGLVGQPRTTEIYSVQRAAEKDEHHDYFTGTVGGDVANGRNRLFLDAYTRTMTLRERKASTDVLDFEGVDASRFRSSNTVTTMSSAPPELLLEEDTASSSTDGPESGLLRGLATWHPELYAWVFDRVGNTQKLALAVAFMLSECARFSMFEYATSKEVNMYSIFWTCDTVSAFLGFLVSIGFDGVGAVCKIINPHSLSRVCLMALLFSLSTALQAGALKLGLAEALARLLGNLYLPLAAAASYFAFNRKYGVLEWLALTMTMLSIAAFMLLRDRCHYYYCGELNLTSEQHSFLGEVLVVCSVAASATASIMMERILQKKGRFAIKANFGYYIYRTQLDVVTSGFWFACLLFLTNHGETSIVAKAVSSQYGSTAWISTVGFFGSWTKRQYFLVAVSIAQRWLAGLVVQQFSTVSRGILSSISTVIVVMLGDWVQMKFGIENRLLPSMLIAVIVLLSAVIFQTGRLNIKALRERIEELHLKAHEVGAAETRDWVTPASLAQHVTSNLRRLKSSNHDIGGVRSMLQPLCKYSIIVYYILADSARTILGMVVNSNRFVVPQTMAMMSPVLSVLFASTMVFMDQGFPGVRKSWDLSKVIKFSVCGLLSAVTQSLLSLAFAVGTSPSLVVGLGKIYTPVVALLSRYILGRFFFWMEWFALIILTCSAVAFSLLQNVGHSSHGSSADTYGMFLIVGSATCSAIMSLVMEKFLKTENEPFIIQKVRMDIGGFVFSLLLLPAMGWLATMPGNPRQDLAFWAYRPGPDYWGCYELAVDYPAGAIRGCDQTTGKFMPNMALIGNSTELQQKAADCICGSGVFLGWGDNTMIYAFMFVTVFHSWIVGKMVSTFSSVDRAVADGFPLLLIFFFLDPLSSRVPLASFQAAYNSGPMAFPPPDLSRDLVCLILPISAWTFNCATTQMDKAMDKLAEAEAELEAAQLAHSSSDNEESDSDGSEDGSSE